VSPVPCFGDSCSTQLSFDPVTGLSVDVNLDPAGCLTCNPGAGLAVNIHPEGALECRSDGGGDGMAVRFYGADDVDPSTVNACDTLLGRTNTNLLFARRPNFKKFNIGNDGIENAPLATSTVVDLSADLRNLQDCERLVIITSKFQFNYTVAPSGGGDRFFSNDMEFTLIVNGTPISSMTENLNGVAPAATNDFRIMTWVRTDFYKIGALATSDIKMRIIRSAANPAFGGTIDGTGPAPGGNTNGFNPSVQGVMVDLGEDLGMFSTP